MLSRPLSKRTANASRPGVFAPPVATFREQFRARAIDLANGLAISVDLDQGDTAALRVKLEDLLGPCTVVVASGGLWVNRVTGEVHDKLHLHWRLSETTRTTGEHELLRVARGLAARLVGGDATAASPAHPLRWPGSWNVKGNPPRLAMICGGIPMSEVHLDAAVEKLQLAVKNGDKSGKASSAGMPTYSEIRASSVPEAEVTRLARAVATIGNEDVPWDEWTRIGMAIYAGTGGTAAGLAIWLAWSSRSIKHEAGSCEERWAHYATSPPKRIGAGTLFYMANEENRRHQVTRIQEQSAAREVRSWQTV